MKIFCKFFLVFLLISSKAFCDEKTLKKPVIIASINPIYQILLAITQDKDNSILIIKSGASEHNYQLKKSDVKFFSKADLIFYIDDELEKNFAKIITNSTAQKKSYKLSAINGIKLLQQRNNPKKLDVHLWLDLQNAIKIAEFMAQKISEIDPENSKKYQKNLKKFKKEILESEKEIRFQLSQIKGSGYIFYHDGYQYFENYFGLKPLKVMFYNEGNEFGMKDAREFDALAHSGHVKCIFSETQDEKKSAMKLAQNYKVKFVTLDLIGAKDESYGAMIYKLANDMSNCLN